MKKTGLLSLMLLLSIFTFAQGRMDVSATEFEQLLKNSKGVLIDVRTPNEYAGGYIKGAGNIDYYDRTFKSKIDLIKKDNVVFVYCLTGARSKSTANYLASKGMKVYNLQRGILGWKGAGLPVHNPAQASSNNDKKGMTASDYKNAISSSKIVLVDFYAPWCGPCKKMSPIIDDIKKSYGSKIKVLKINVDDNSDLSQELSIKSIPLLYIYKNGTQVYLQNGTVTKETLMAEIDKLL